jgi:hypothetical protein
MNIMTARMIAENFGITVSADDAPKLIAAIQNAYATGRRDESTLLANTANAAMKFTENQDLPTGECGVLTKSGEHPTPQMQLAGGAIALDYTGVDTPTNTVGWLTAARVWIAMENARKTVEAPQ